MRILMLGWEFPPFIAGGLGVACYGLTKALDRLGHEVMFILPRAVERSHASHIRLLSPTYDPARAGGGGGQAGGVPPELPGEGAGEGLSEDASAAQGAVGPDGYHFRHATFRGVEASFSNPYPRFVYAGDGPTGAGAFPGMLSDPPLELDGPGLGLGDADAGEDPLAALAATLARASRAGSGAGLLAPAIRSGSAASAGQHYSGDLVADAERYARLVVALARRAPFDVIHAHDWLTFPAGAALARLTHKPLVVHVHSTEFDRSGDNVHQPVYDIERRGMAAAHRVVAVSMYTKSILVTRYGVRAGKIDVVYNGIDAENQQPSQGAQIGSADKIVLFLGRLTMQKGPEYFIAAARRVLEKIENVKFIVAGSGDMATRMIDLAAQLGIGHKVLFTGFLRGRDVDRVFRMADCYVMPSVSEPFGIAALEAIQNDVPIIISKQSGVSEVLTHCLKVDFWDVDEMANKIVAVLRHPPLSATLRQHGTFELRRLTWEGAAEKCLESYARASQAPAAGPAR